MSVTVEIALGELLDKISILEIKRENAITPEQRRHIEAELGVLAAARDRAIPGAAPIADLFARLKDINGQLWAVEDALRDCERRNDFGEGFVALARSVYRLNDRRGQVKRELNLLLGSQIVEEKLYADY